MKDINYALMLIKANKLDGARDLLEELLQTDPRDKDILYNLGMCYSELGEPVKAVNILFECVRYYPHYANAYVALGFAHSMLAEDEKAKENFLRALEIDPSNPYALRNLGGLYGKTKDYEKALACFEKSYSINPEDQHTAYGLGYTYFHHRRGLFVAQVVGESMNRRIPNGAWCLFRLKPAGTRQGKVVLVQHRDIADTDTGGHYTVKVYESTKEIRPDGSWRHVSIILRSDTTAPGYKPFVLSEEQGDDLKVIAELVAVLS